MSIEGTAAIVGKFVVSHLPIGLVFTVLSAVGAGAWYVSAQEGRVAAVEKQQKEIKAKVDANATAVNEVKMDIAVIKTNTQNIDTSVKAVTKEVSEVGRAVGDVKVLLEAKKP